MKVPCANLTQQDQRKGNKAQRLTVVSQASRSLQLKRVHQREVQAEDLRVKSTGQDRIQGNHSKAQSPLVETQVSSSLQAHPRQGL